MNNFKNAVYRFMMGRYGADQLNNFMLITAIVLTTLNMFFLRNVFVSTLVWVLLILNIFRTYSRNIYKRKAENDKFLLLVSPFKKRINIYKKNRTDLEYKYFLCPTCKQMVRVPRNRGAITITCPKCSRKFDKKS